MRKVSFILAALMTLSLATVVPAEENVYYGQNDHGVGGTIKVAVTMDGDTIEGIKTVEQNESRGLGTTAIMQLTKDIVDKNSLDVDLVSGATLSSIAFTAAVRQAVEEATEFDPTADVELGENEYIGISENALGGRLMVKVAMDGETISDIEVLEAHESEEIGMLALDTQIEKMVEANGTEVDSVSGATITCTALKEAVDQAVASAKE